MKSLSKVQVKTKDEHVEAIRLLQEKLETAVTEYNTVLAHEKEKVEAIFNDLNAAVTEAEEFRDGINSDQENYYDERSDTWREGDAGQSYETWKDSWQGQLEEVKLDFPSNLEAPECPAADELEEMPDSPE